MLRSEVAVGAGASSSAKLDGSERRRRWRTLNGDASAISLYRRPRRRLCRPSRNDQVSAGPARALSAARCVRRRALDIGPFGMRESWRLPSNTMQQCPAFRAWANTTRRGLTCRDRQEYLVPRGRRAESQLSREETRRRLGFAVTQEPVTAVQLSRGKAEAQLLFEITLLTQDLGRLAADLLLFYTQEFAFVNLPDTFTTGSSIMPQKRNPDVFELMRGRSAVAQAALNEVLGITQKLTSGYHRDLQLIKPPLFRGTIPPADAAILPGALDGENSGREHSSDLGIRRRRSRVGDRRRSVREACAFVLAQGSQ